MSDKHFKVRNKKNDDGTYTLSYGRGSKKLEATMTKTGSLWDVVSGDGTANVSGHKTMKNCKSEWAAWAENEYYSEKQDAPAAGPPSLPSPPALPSPPSLPGPPSLPTAPKKPSRPVPDVPKGDEGRHHEFQCDPFEPAFHYPKDDELFPQKLTPLGALDEVYNWMTLNPHRVYYPSDTHDGLLPPFHQVLNVLQREFSEEKYPAPARK